MLVSPHPDSALQKVEATIVLSFMLSVHEVALNARDKEAKGLKWRPFCNHLEAEAEGQQNLGRCQGGAGTAAAPVRGGQRSQAELS